MLTIKRIAGGLLAVVLWVAACAVLILGAGCASNPTGTPATERAVDTARLVVRAAALAYIERSPLEERAARAARVIGVTGAILAELGDGEPVSVQDLQVLAVQHLPADLTPAQRVLALELIDVAVAELLARTGVGDLRSDTLVKVGEILSWVDGVARLYTSS